MYVYSYFNHPFTGPHDLSVNITKLINSSTSVVVQWDKVDDSLTTTYIVNWDSERDRYISGDRSVHSVILIEQSSYNITGLTLDTVYTITVSASNSCGTGPRYSSDIILIVTISSIIPTTSIAPVTIATYATTNAIIASTTQCNNPAGTTGKYSNTSKV